MTTPISMTPITAPVVGVSQQQTQSTATTAPTSTSVSLLQEILKQLHIVAKPPPPPVAPRSSAQQQQQQHSSDNDNKGGGNTTTSTAGTHGVQQPEPDIPINIDKLIRMKESFFGPGDSPELEEFLLMYLETLQICKHEYLSLEGSIQEVARTLREQQIKANKKKKRKRKNLPESSKNLLKKWLADHWFHPYPSNEEKLQLCEQTGISMHSLNHWFINARRRNVLCYALGTAPQDKEGGGGGGGGTVNNNNTTSSTPQAQ